MALIMKSIDSWNKYMDMHGDPRTKDWFMMSSPFPTLFVCLAYVFIVKVAGPRLMENRKPFRLQNTLIVYNALQVVFSAWIFFECLKGGWWGHYSFRCQPVEYDNHPRTIRIGFSGWLTGHYSFRCQPVEYNNNPRTIRMVHACWWYYFSKFTEFFDTFFFILRKKQSQVTTLHVIHHGCMPMSVWFGVKFTPGGHSTFFGLLNTFVHIIMYTYYMLSAMGPQFQKYLWWKKYLTTLQMVQFILIMVHAFQLLFVDCNYPKAFVWWIGMHAVMFFFLFNEFYKQAYKSRHMRASKNLDYDMKNEKTINGYSNGICKKIDHNDSQQQEQVTTKTTNGYIMSNGKLNNQQNNHSIQNSMPYQNGSSHKRSQSQSQTQCQSQNQSQSQSQNPSHSYSNSNSDKDSDSYNNNGIKLANGSAYTKLYNTSLTNGIGVGGGGGGGGAKVVAEMELTKRKVIQQNDCDHDYDYDHREQQQQQQQQQQQKK